MNLSRWCCGIIHFWLQCYCDIQNFPLLHTISGGLALILIGVFKYYDNMQKNVITISFVAIMMVGCGKEKQPESEPEPTMTIVDVTDGTIKAPFSIGDGKVVYFSQGNLQYKATTNEWRFAEEQYDVIGEDNKNISASYSGWIDLFGWATSGYQNNYPYSTSTESNVLEDISGTQYDWGQNAIINGGNQQGLWRTLTRTEWENLMSRWDSEQQDFRCYRVRINGVYGLLLVPDNWKWGASGVGYAPYCKEEISDSKWRNWQKYGAVFLPEEGSIHQNSVSDTVTYQSWDYGYWSSTPYATNYVGYVYYVEWGICGEKDINYSGLRKQGYCVRLVRDKQ